MLKVLIIRHCMIRDWDKLTWSSVHGELSRPSCLMQGRLGCLQHHSSGSAGQIAKNVSDTDMICMSPIVDQDTS
jgi:hypothetical protein